MLFCQSSMWLFSKRFPHLNFTDLDILSLITSSPHKTVFTALSIIILTQMKVSIESFEDVILGQNSAGSLVSSSTLSQYMPYIFLLITGFLLTWQAVCMKSWYTLQAQVQNFPTWILYYWYLLIMGN